MPEELNEDVTSDEEFDPYTIKISTKREKELFDKTSRYKTIVKRRQSELNISQKSLPKDQRRRSKKYSEDTTKQLTKEMDRNPLE